MQDAKGDLLRIVLGLPAPGCTIAGTTTKQFVCPCHNGQFTAEGAS